MAKTESPAPPISSKMLFEQLTTRLKGKSDLSQRVLSHIREVSGHNSLPAFINNGASEQEKVETLAACLRAVITGDFDKLKGGIPKGQAPAGNPPEEVVAGPKIVSYKIGVKTSGDKDWCYNGVRMATADEAKAYGQDLFSRWTAVTAWEVHPSDEPVSWKWENGKGVMLETKPTVEPEKPVVVTEPITETVNMPPPMEENVNAKMAALVDALKGLVQPSAEPAGIDEARVREIARSEFQKMIAEQIHEEVKTAKFELGQQIDKMRESSLKQLAKAIAEAV